MGVEIDPRKVEECAFAKKKNYGRFVHNTICNSDNLQKRGLLRTVSTSFRRAIQIEECRVREHSLLQKKKEKKEGLVSSN